MKTYHLRKKLMIGAIAKQLSYKQGEIMMKLMLSQWKNIMKIKAMKKTEQLTSTNF